MKIYNVSFDADGEIIETKDLGTIVVEPRVVQVQAVSATEARKHAAVLYAQGRRN